MNLPKPNRNDLFVSWCFCLSSLTTWLTSRTDHSFGLNDWMRNITIIKAALRSITHSNHYRDSVLIIGRRRSPEIWGWVIASGERRVTKRIFLFFKQLYLKDFMGGNDGAVLLEQGNLRLLNQIFMWTWHKQAWWFILPAIEYQKLRRVRTWSKYL